jgi:hypothetical protein
MPKALQREPARGMRGFAEAARRLRSRLAGFRLLGRDADPASSRDPVLLSAARGASATRRIPIGFAGTVRRPERALTQSRLAPRRWIATVDRFMSKRDRASLASRLKIAGGLADLCGLAKRNCDRHRALAHAHEMRRTPATIVSVAHLDDDERTLVLGVLMEELLTWVRGLSGSKRWPISCSSP